MTVRSEALVLNHAIPEDCDGQDFKNFIINMNTQFVVGASCC